jgi:ribosomal protein S18 acetylase RimI-like enzyme
MIIYTDSLEGITADQLHGGFFDGWPNPPIPETHFKILRGSFAFVLAVDDQTGQVVGFITAVSDGVSAAYIPHLEVLRAYRQQRIGSELVQRMLARLSDLYMIDLICDDDVQPFYARLGMRPCGGMIIRNYDRQSCS